MIKKFLGFAAKTAGLVAVLSGAQTAAWAETTDLDVKVGAKAAAFVQPSLTGEIPTAIVFDPANAASKADADAIAAAIGSGLAIKGGTLKAQLVPVNEIGSLGNVKVIFVAHGLGDHMSAVAEASRAGSILTISNDMNCVEVGLCVVGVESKPKVSIVVSKSATAAANLQFGAAFLMMVQER
jgi:hypothetical protein